MKIDHPKFKQVFIATARRSMEIKRMRKLSTVKMPNGLSESEKIIFENASDHMLGTREDFFTKQLSDAMAKADARFFEVVALAARAVVDARTVVPKIGDAHAISLLQSKLYLEGKSGKLPTQKDVREYASKVFVKWFSPYGLEPYPLDKIQRWQPAFKKAELDYLKEGVRGAGKGK